jgi:ADP-ribose pyrophosphatase YjhB (NUDIX family)
VIEKVRAVLLTPAGRMLTIRRTWPGAEPFWVLPGGHVEPYDPDLRAALVREVHEETGGRPRILGLLWSLTDDHKRQHIYLARIDAWSEADRTGPEFADPDRGEYKLEEVALTPQALGPLELVPEEFADFLRDKVQAGLDLTALADPAG